MLTIIPHELSDFQSYGKWNCLCAYNPEGELIDTIPAHGGDFLPESPFDHINELKKYLNHDLTNERILWPVRVDIDITQKCSDNCYFCYSRPYTNCLRYNNAQIDLADFEKIIQDLATNGTKTIRLTGGGEPLIHPQIKDLILIPKKYGLKSCILTNGSLLNEEICELLINNIDQIRISLNAASDQTRLKLHRAKIKVNSLSEIYKLIYYSRKLRDMQWPNQRKPLIWTTFLLLPENVHEMEQAIVQAKASGADSISFRPIYHNLSNEINDINEIGIISQLEEFKAKYTDDQFYVFVPKRNFSSVWDISPKSYFSNCISCKLRTIIEATESGQLLTICGLYRGIAEKSLGLINENNSFSTIWYDTKIAEILKSKPLTCNHCIDLSMNVSLNRIFSVLLKEPDAVFYKAFIHSNENIPANKGETFHYVRKDPS